jgi:hypothetical protein
MVMMRLGLITLVAAGCSFHASYDGTHYQCGAGDSCPSGQTCVAGECVIGAPDVDGPLGAPDSAIDGGASVSPCGSLTALRDDFSTDRVGTYWSRWSDGGPTAQVANGQLAIHIPTNTSDQGAGYGSWFYYGFTDSEARVTVSQIADHDTILEVRDYTNQKLQLLVQDGNLIAAEYNTASPGEKAQVPYDPSTHKRWRLRDTAGTAYWEWSVDGITWNVLYSEPDPLHAQHVLLELAADGNGTSEAHFDDLDVAAPDPGLCGASSLADDFVDATFGPSWDVWYDNHVTVGIVSGGAEITSDGTSNVWGGFQSRHLLDLRGDSFYVDARGIPQEGGYVSWVDADVPGDGNTYLELSVDGGTLYMVQTIAGTDVNTKSIPYDSTAHRYWRFRADASMAYWDTSPDAATWTQRFAAPAALDPTAIQFVLGAGEYQAVTGATTRYGSINVP